MSNDKSNDMTCKSFFVLFQMVLLDPSCDLTCLRALWMYTQDGSVLG